MGTSKRYSAHYDELNRTRAAETSLQPEPCTLPSQAYGPQPIAWERGRKPPVWAWISWRDGPATRIPCYAAGWNDRVVVVEWEARGGQRSVVVWRNAVTRRQAASSAPAMPER